jgi:hypothetical protein
MSTPPSYHEKTDDEPHPTLADWHQLAARAQAGDRKAARLMTERLMAFTAQTAKEAKR